MFSKEATSLLLYNPARQLWSSQPEKEKVLRRKKFRIQWKECSFTSWSMSIRWKSILKVAYNFSTNENFYKQDAKGFYTSTEGLCWLPSQLTPPPPQPPPWCSVWNWHSSSHPVLSDLQLGYWKLWPGSPAGRLKYYWPGSITIAFLSKKCIKHAFRLQFKTVLLKQQIWSKWYIGPPNFAQPILQIHFTLGQCQFSLNMMHFLSMLVPGSLRSIRWFKWSSHRPRASYWLWKVTQKVYKNPTNSKTIMTAFVLHGLLPLVD